ncbi:MAG: hypothetical protein EDX89_24505 [Acidobacteria bacterium]|nr:MAG: hypothetical protein EDX89_24505 [Acidobacteriota bacterium]MCE7959819.1 hypothetical protein [Acidobacteria bacterium ACB2]
MEALARSGADAGKERAETAEAPVEKRMVDALPPPVPDLVPDPVPVSTTATSRVSEGTSRGDRAPFAPPPRGGRGLEEPAPHAAVSPFPARMPEIAQIPAFPETYAQGGRSDGGNGRRPHGPALMRRLKGGF